MNTQFYKDVLEFLKSAYNDAYEFNLEVSRGLYSEDTVELLIKICRGYTVKIGNYCMKYIYSLYCTGEYIQERKIFRWQKELINMIEGA